jgi:polygalacturonase
MFHIVLGNVNGGYVSHVNVSSPGSHDPTNPSNNTDGIDVTNSQNVLVEYCNVSVGEYE